MTSSSSRGAVIFGINNEKIDYIELAVICARLARRNAGIQNTCLITDKHSKEYFEGQGRSLGEFFTHIRLIPDEPEVFENRRAYRDTRYYHVDAQFKNNSRSLAYELSPFDETLLIDCDYLLFSPALNAVWGSDEEVMINKSAIDLFGNELTGPEFRLNPFGIRMYWATVIYFRKGKKAKTLFDLVEHIKENWSFYKALYEVPGHLYRNDYAFSIALHVLSGYTEEANVVSSLPYPSLLTALDTDQLFKVRSEADVSVFANDPVETWKFYVARLKGLDLHCMNKISLINLASELHEVLQ